MEITAKTTRTARIEKKRRLNLEKFRELLSDGIEQMGDEQRFRLTYLYQIVNALPPKDKQELEALRKRAFPLTTFSEKFVLASPMGYMERSIAALTTKYPFSGRLLVLLSIGVPGVISYYTLESFPVLSKALGSLAFLYGSISILRFIPPVSSYRRRYIEVVKKLCAEKGII